MTSKLYNIHISSDDCEVQVHGNTLVLTLSGRFDYENETYDFSREYEFSIHNNTVFLESDKFVDNSVFLHVDKCRALIDESTYTFDKLNDAYDSYEPLWEMAHGTAQGKLDYYNDKKL